tara:strand:- start:906 stop:1016 length:111 start_codon:yes stop_codon:yes gene_type:complete
MIEKNFKNQELAPKVTEEQTSIGGEAPEKDDEECDA